MKLVFAVLAASIACAQESRGSILGRVVDSSHAVAAGAKITITHKETNTVFRAVTNGSGNYEAPYLVSGAYRVVAELPGFKTAVRDNLELRINDKLEIDFQLELGAVNESVTVSAETPLLATATSSMGTVVSSRIATELPVSGGNVMHLTRFTPGMTATGGHAPANPTQDLGAGAVASSGTRSGLNEVTLDGAPSNYRGNSVYSAPPQDMVEEMRVETASYDASTGHTAGGAVNVSTKSGTNTFHGTSYMLDSRLRAVPWFSNRFLYDPTTGPINDEKRALANPGWRYKRWGATASGPIVRNKSFWSFGYEGMQVQRQATFTGTFPTAEQKAGNFSRLLALGSQYQIYDPFSAVSAAGGRVQRTPVPGNIIPAARQDAIGRKIASFWPEPNVAGTPEGRQNYFKIEQEKWNYRSLSARVDHHFSERHRVFGRWSTTEFDQRIRSFPSDATGSWNNPLGYRGALDDVLTFSPSLLLNLKYGLVYQMPWSRPLHAGYDIKQLGFSQNLVDTIARQAPLSGMAFPSIGADAYTALGAGGGSADSIYYHSFAGTLTKISGNHSLKAGGEFRLMRDNGFAFGNVSPAFTFGAAYTRGPLDTSPAAPIGQGLASLLYGLPTAGSVDVNASRAEQGTFTGFFLHDDWKLRRNVTVNMGVRYEYEQPSTERFNRSVVDYDFGSASPVDAAARAAYTRNPIAQVPIGDFRLTGGIRFAGVGGVGRSLWNADRNNFAPRIGLAWQPRKNAVVRTGYGIFYGQLGVERQRVNQTGFSQATLLVPSLNNGLSFYGTLQNPLPDGVLPAPGASAGLATNLGRGVSFFNQKPRNQYMQRWSLSMQHQLPGRLVADISYVGNRGTKLPISRQWDAIPAQYYSTSPARDQAAIDFFNAQVPNPFGGIREFTGTGLQGTTIARSNLLRPYPHFTSIAFTEPAGYSWYHSMQASVEKRFSHGLTFQTGWTYSKLMEAISYLNDFDRSPYENVSDLDATHRFTIAGLYELPFAKKNRWFGGWQVQGMFEGQSGFPLGFGNVIFNGSLQNVEVPVGDRRAERWFNTGAGFERLAARQLGANVRLLPLRFNGIRGDGINNLDASMLKTFPVTEHVRLQFRMEAINAFNHVQFADPNTTPTSDAFGSITAEKGHGQRQINMVLKVIF